MSLRQASQAPLLLKVNPKYLPSPYKKTVVEPDKKALREALKQGDQSVEQFCELGIRSTYLSIR